MKEINYKIKSNEDGLELSVLKVIPDEKVKGVIQIIHGMTEYKERYLDFMHFLAGNGYVCIIHDHRGHGQSVENVEELGYFYEGGWKALIEDIHQVMLEIKSEYKEVPYYMIGHSMGSLAARCFIKKYDNEIDKLIISGCPSKLPGMKPGHAFVKIVGKIKGEKNHSKILDYLVVNSNYEKRYKSEKIVHAWVNSDRKCVEAYNADPFCNYSFTINGYRNLVELTMETYSPKNYELKNPNLKIRFLSGAGDPCAISKKNIAKAMNCLKRAGYYNVRGKMYNGMRHEILNEPGHMKVYKDIIYYLEEKHEY